MLAAQVLFALLPNGGCPMIRCELQAGKGVLRLPEGPLETADCTLIASQIDAYLADHGKLHGVLIHEKSFRGWKDFSAMLAHFNFLRDHIKRIEKVAVVTDGALADVMRGIANHFVHAQVRHFDFMRADVFVAAAVCTHLGCTPILHLNDAALNAELDAPGGFLCPCHGSRFDLAGGL
jgi:nitrite reductase/ring-hydroxylating ferredoxin subunit